MPFPPSFPLPARLLNSSCRDRQQQWKFLCNDITALCSFDKTRLVFLRRIEDVFSLNAIIHVAWGGKRIGSPWVRSNTNVRSTTLVLRHERRKTDTSAISPLFANCSSAVKQIEIVERWGKVTIEYNRSMTNAGEFLGRARLLTRACFTCQSAYMPIVG